MSTEGNDWLTEWFAARADLHQPLFEPADGFLVPPAFAEDLAKVVKLSGYIDIADELLNPPKLPPPSWRTRLRWKRDAWRETLARRTYRLIAGYDPPDGDDW